MSDIQIKNIGIYTHLFLVIHVSGSNDPHEVILTVKMIKRRTQTLTYSVGAVPHFSLRLIFPLRHPLLDRLIMIDSHD